MMRIQSAPKTCHQCSRSFERSRNHKGRLETTTDWNKRRFCTHQCYAKWHTGTRHHYWRGGVKHRPDGYVRDSRTDEYIHRQVLAAALGRPLLPTEVVHHKNHDPGDNRLENLCLLPSQAAHAQGHYLHRALDPKTKRFL